MATTRPPKYKYSLAGVAGTGSVSTVKGTPLLCTPPTVTTTFPVVAPLGTLMVILPALQLAAVPAFVPLNVTELVPCEEPKFTPAIVTGVPMFPVAGVRLVIDGALAVAVKLTTAVCVSVRESVVSCAVYVTFSAVVSVAVNVTIPPLFDGPLAPEIVECPAPWLIATVLPLTGLPPASFSVTVIVAVLDPLAATDIGFAITVELEAVGAAVVKITDAV